MCGLREAQAVEIRSPYPVRVMCSDSSVQLRCCCFFQERYEDSDRTMYLVCVSHLFGRLQTA